MHLENRRMQLPAKGKQMMSSFKRKKVSERRRLATKPMATVSPAWNVKVIEANVAAVVFRWPILSVSSTLILLAFSEPTQQRRSISQYVNLVRTCLYLMDEE